MAYGVKTISISAMLLLFLTTFATANDTLFKTSLDNFSQNIFSELFKTKGEKNIIFSPFSVQTVLSMVRQGAEGQTAVEMDKGLSFTGQTVQSVADNYHSLLTKYENSNVFKTANKVFVMQGHELKDEYNEVLSKNFFSTADVMDFTQKEKAANVINSWVESKTNNTIKDLVSADSLTADTLLFLLSASYFKGSWLYPFDEKRTNEAEFYIDETHTKMVPMMTKSEIIQFARLDMLDATAVRLPYKDSDLSMMIILPNEKTGLASMVEKMKNVPLQLLSEKSQRHGVQLTLPKFKAEFEIELTKTLQNMGMKQMFGNAEFGKMLKSPDVLTVSQVIHKAFIEVNEYGTEASAATGAGIRSRARPTSFNANHPFYYVILNEDSVPLFQGTYLGL